MLNKRYIKVLSVVITINIVITMLFLMFGHEKKLTITPKHFPYKVATDQVLGGKSQANLDVSGDKAMMSCTLITSDYEWPYCEMTINLTEDVQQGLDLSGFNRVYLDIDYVSPEAKAHRVRVYVRNFEAAVFDPKDDNTLKYNGIEYHPGFGQGGKNIGYDKFSVITWWLFDYNIPVEESGVNFDNVSMIQIATDSGSVIGDHVITVNKIVFKGDYISTTVFSFILLSTWIGAAIIFLFSEVFEFRRHVRKVERYVQHLKYRNETLENKYQVAHQLAIQDELTGASNRHAIREWLDNIAEKVRSGTSMLAIIYFDLDHFKLVNDTFGHNVGDQILREFVDLIQRDLRDNDHLVRWGGEEFIIFCPNETLDAASIIAERIRNKIIKYSWPEIGMLTCSFGVTEMVNSESVTDMIARADEALYNAKNNGRNRVEVLVKLN